MYFRLTFPTGEIIDTKAAGKLTYEQPFSDMDIPRFESLPKDAMHRNVTLEAVQADTEGGCLFEYKFRRHLL